MGRRGWRRSGRRAGLDDMGPVGAQPNPQGFEFARAGREGDVGALSGELRIVSKRDGLEAGSIPLEVLTRRTRSDELAIFPGDARDRGLKRRWRSSGEKGGERLGDLPTARGSTGRVSRETREQDSPDLSRHGGQRGNLGSVDANQGLKWGLGAKQPSARCELPQDDPEGEQVATLVERREAHPFGAQVGVLASERGLNLGHVKGTRNSEVDELQAGLADHEVLWRDVAVRDLQGGTRGVVQMVEREPREVADGGDELDRRRPTRVRAHERRELDTVDMLEQQIRRTRDLSRLEGPRNERVIEALHEAPLGQELRDLRSLSLGMGQQALEGVPLARLGVEREEDLGRSTN